MKRNYMTAQTIYLYSSETAISAGRTNLCIDMTEREL